LPSDGHEKKQRAQHDSAHLDERGRGQDGQGEGDVAGQHDVLKVPEGPRPCAQQPNRLARVEGSLETGDVVGTVLGASIWLTNAAQTEAETQLAGLAAVVRRNWIAELESGERAGPAQRQHLGLRGRYGRAEHGRELLNGVHHRRF